MNKTILTLAVIIITLGSASAQNFIGKINPFSNQNVSVLSDDTVKILAVMVNFQEDRDGLTFGNGKFGSIYSQNYGNTILDPLPHDKNYFESHLTFVKNYYQKVSNEKVNVQFTVLPDTFSVSKTMRNYSPIPGSTDFTPLGQFAQEVWTKADELNPGFNFSDYDVFLIFHAGVGRDISLPGSLGNERDLPSVYLNDNALKNIFGQSFDGFAVSGGTFKIKNSMIIPETESRELESITGKFLFEITINGLLAASVGSYLGLPDLFDTETGLSAIGRFGLMDGQAIFAYNGVFPPEPSAWEKIYLGWTEPASVDSKNYDVSLVPALAATLVDTMILKVPLNSSEYYLIENRQRNVFDNGVTLTISSNGSILNKTFLRDTTGFYSYDTDSLFGVITDVSEFDWALPGSGIVIWHIDENVIKAKLAENKINTNKNNRGVAVVEADGIQDIGEEFTTVFGDVVIGEGSQEDFWYAGNKSKFYKNIFDKNTRPNTNTNSGANSLITIKNFTPVSNRMSFNVAYGDSIIKPIFTSTFNNLVDNISVIEDGDSVLFAFEEGTNLLVSDGKNIIDRIPEFSEGFKVASITVGEVTFIVGTKGSSVNYWVKQPSNIIKGSFDLTYNITAAPVIRKNIYYGLDLILGTSDGVLYVYDLLSIWNQNPVRKDSILIEPDQFVKKIAASENSIFAITEYSGEILGSVNLPSYFFSTDGEKFKFEFESLTDLAVSVNNTGKTYFVLSTDRSLYMNGNVNSSLYGLQLDKPITSFSLADLKQDGNNYILINNGSKLAAYNLTGSSADNFPVLKNSTQSLLFTPLAADIEGDSKPEIIVTDSLGNVYAFDGGTGKLIDGFPISFGNPLKTEPVLFNYKGQTALAGYDSDNKFTAWVISSIFTLPDWAETNANSQNTSFVEAAKNSNAINQFLPTNRVYNYPNPVYNNQTAIRYFVNEDSKINIKIFDLAGDFVQELNSEAKGGFDNETIWTTGAIQSGVYLARVEATGVSGKSESVVIKIAVVK